MLIVHIKVCEKPQALFYHSPTTILLYCAAFLDNTQILAAPSPYAFSMLPGQPSLPLHKVCEKPQALSYHSPTTILLYCAAFLDNAQILAFPSPYASSRLPGQPSLPLQKVCEKPQVLSYHSPTTILPYRAGFLDNAKILAFASPGLLMRSL